MWPRTAALAEVLWTGKANRAGNWRQPYLKLSPMDQAKEDANRERFRARLRNFRCLLLKRGVAASPVDQPPGLQLPQGLAAQQRLDSSRTGNSTAFGFSPSFSCWSSASTLIFP